MLHSKENARYSRRTSHERFERVHALRPDHALLALGERVLVSPSGYYAWRNRQSNPGPRALESLARAEDIKLLHAQSRQTYGRPRLREALLKEGRHHGRHRLARRMQAAGLCGRQKGRYRVRTTDRNQPAPQRLAEAPDATAPNPIGVADITYIQPRQGGL